MTPPKPAKEKPTAPRSSGESIVMSSRIRLARNLSDVPFPCKAAAADMEEVCRRVKAAECMLLPDWEPLGKAPRHRREMLFEAHLISPYMLKQHIGSAVRWDGRGRHSVMVNEEDHLRIQVLTPGLSLQEAWREADILDNMLEAELDYAFSPALGYLTSCPTNIGTGLRASVMIHLPALALLEELAPIANGLGKIGMTIRGFFGEGSEPRGAMFQISNQVTMGLAETRIVADLEEIVKEIVEHEKNARQRLLDTQPMLVYDVIWRSAAILSSAYLMSADEALNRLSDVRLGVAMGLLPEPSIEEIDELMTGVQPGHLRATFGRDLAQQERDALRAAWLRSKIKAPKNLKRMKKKDE